MQGKGVGVEEGVNEWALGVEGEGVKGKGDENGR